MKMSQKIYDTKMEEVLFKNRQIKSHTCNQEFIEQSNEPSFSQQDDCQTRTDTITLS